MSHVTNSSQEKTKKTNDRSFRPSGKWFRPIASILAFGLLYIVYDMYYPISGEKPGPGVVEEPPQDTLRNRTHFVPAPSRIFKIIQTAGADFDPHLINDYRNYESYCTSVNKAAFNMGVYETDLCYLIMYGESREAWNYMAACLALTRTLGAREAVDFDVLQRFERNLWNPDSLNHILNQFNKGTLTFLDEHDLRHYSALLISGIVIEALYISTQIIGNYPAHLLEDDMRMQVLSPLISMLIDQKKSLEYVIDLLKGKEDKGDWELAVLGSMQELYEGYPQEELHKLISEKNAKEFLNNEAISRLAERVRLKRNEFIS